MDGSNYSPVNSIIDEVVREVTNQNPSGQLRNISMLIWFIGALFDNSYLYFAGLVLVILSSMLVVFDAFNEKGKLSSLKNIGLSTVIAGLINNWLYESFFHRGKDIVILVGQEISLSQITSYVLIGSLFLWLSTRYFSLDIPFQELSSESYIILFLHGIMKGILIYGMIDYLFIKSEFVVEYTNVFLATLVMEPFVAYIFFSGIKTLGTRLVSITDMKHPLVAMRDSLFSNIFILLISEFFSPSLRNSSQGLSIILFIAFVLLFWYGRESASKVMENPFGSSPLGSFLKDGGTEIQVQNFSSKLVHVIEESQNLKINKKTNMEIAKGSIVLPIKERDSMMQIMVIGDTKEIVETDYDAVLSSNEGICTTLISKDEYGLLEKSGRRDVLSNIDLSSLGLPNVDVISDFANALGELTNMWSSNLSKKLVEFDLSKAGVHESKEFTKVNIPGIVQVLESKGIGDKPKFTFVKLPFGKIMDFDKNGVMVNLPGIKVIDTKELTAVNVFGFIKVLDTHKRGTLVNLLGFTINDGMDERTLSQVKSNMIGINNSFANAMEQVFDTRFESLLTNEESAGVFSLSWDKQFRPLLSSNSLTSSERFELPTGVSNHLLNKGEVKFLPESQEYTDADFEVLDE